MRNKPKRNIILFLVEGKSDREALQGPIQELYDRKDENNEVVFRIINEEEAESGGDVTTRTGVYPENIEAKINKLFLGNFFKVNGLNARDISEIIQIVDTDGVYIPNDAVREKEEQSGDSSTFYDDKTINCSNASNIIRRNEHKRKNLDYLISLKRITIRQFPLPYSIYYFSCNLDHFLHNSANLEPRMKRSLASIFADNFIDNPDGFVNIISGDPSAVTGMNYGESWNYIKDDLNSLQRHTNLNILLDKIVSD